ncbi:predicted protein [Uncinocarpus reesii 1704]|uniref:Nudix hydrolase domain-containing protein n=1 Tax=Uncinocarpus reesii (strain UAMH 1704) TaxID=336963 RepID=C4JNS7_UNCRE|nr:uncharacterized protein UREG_04397 [Uncinocarpus reesii 1704]EEP79551.1 predicted protein [Uncinocarpus reesii 1704]
MSTFTLPGSNPPVPVHLPANLSENQLLSFPAFKIWLSTLQRSLSTQKSTRHEFHSAPYALRKIEVQAVDFFGGDRVGSSFNLMTFHPARKRKSAGTFSGSAAKEIQEETGLSIQQDELVDMTALTAHIVEKNSQKADDTKEELQNGVYPSPGGSDEFIPLFLYQKRLKRSEIEKLQGQLTGLRIEGEKITLKLVPLKDLWKEGFRDGKTLAAWALYQGLIADELI